MFKYLVLAILGFAVGVGGAFIVAQQGAPGPASAAAPGEPIFVTIGAFPEANVVVEMDGSVDFGGQSMPFTFDGSGTMRGETAGDNTDWYLFVERFEGAAGDERFEQALGLTARYRFDAAGRLVDVSTNEASAGPMPTTINQWRSNLDLMAVPFPPEGVRIGDSFTFTQEQPMDSQFGIDNATSTMTVTVTDLIVYQGREALALRMDGTIDAGMFSGSIDGSSVVDIESGATLNGDVDLSMGAGAGGDGLAVNVSVSFAMQF